MNSYVRIGLVLGCLVVWPVVAKVQDRANYSGTWILDKSKSDVSQLFGVEAGLEKAKDASLTMVVEQQGTTIKVIRTVKVNGEERKETHTYKTDGTETTNSGLRGESVVTRASWEGDSLVVVSTRSMKVLMKEFTVESKGVWKLSPDRKTLTIDGHVHGPRRNGPVKAVFNKQ